MGIRGVTYKGDGGLLSFPSRIGKTSETTEGFPRAGMSWDPLLPEQEDWLPVQASTLAAMCHCSNTANLTLWFDD